MSRTRISTQVAITTKRHVDIKLCHPQFNRSSIGCEDGGFFLGALFCRHVNAVDRTGAHTLAATNAIFNLVEKPHPRSFRQGPFLVRVLKGGGAGEQTFKSNGPPKQFNGSCRTSNSRGKKMLEGNPHPEQHSPNEFE